MCAVTESSTRGNGNLERKWAIGHIAMKSKGTRVERGCQNFRNTDLEEKKMIMEFW
jgi:hypothetical protein